MPIMERKYTTGDTVLFLGQSSENGTINSFTRLNNNSVGAARLTLYPLLLVEGRVRDTWEEDGTCGLILRYKAYLNNDNAPPDATSDSEVLLTEHNFGQQTTKLRNALLNSPGMTQAKAAFLKQFMYPLVTSSNGYQSLLRDLAIIMDRDPAEVMTADMQMLKTQAAEHGIQFVPYNIRSKIAGFNQQIRQGFQDMYNILDQYDFNRPPVPQLRGEVGVVEEAIVRAVPDAPPPFPPPPVNAFDAVVPAGPNVHYDVIGRAWVIDEVQLANPQQQVFQNLQQGDHN